MSQKTKNIIFASAAVLVLVLLLVLILKPESPETNTAEFFSAVNTESFWYDSAITEGKTTYSYVQGVKNGVVTTIEDYENNENDSYEIFSGNYVHYLYMDEYTYDTDLYTKGDNPKGIRFLFANYSFESFNDPKSAQDELLNGKNYYCETFDTVDSKGNAVGENKFYFQDNRLKVIVWTENGETVRTMIINDYSNTVPDNICFAPPSNFEGGNLTQTDEYDYSDLMDDDSYFS